MLYLITQIVFFLIAAYALGLLTGWALWRNHEPDTSEADTRLTECTSKLDDARSTIRNLERKVASLQSEPTSHFPVPGANVTPEPGASELGVSGPAAAAFIDDAAPTERAHETPADPDLVAPEASGESAAQSEGAAADDEAPEAAGPDPFAAAFPPADDPSPAYDDLKRISGIGATIERQLAEIGITTYRQIAHFTDEDIERVGAHIDFFPDRIRREGWVVQAAALHRETYGTQP